MVMPKYDSTTSAFPCISLSVHTILISQKSNVKLHHVFHIWSSVTLTKNVERNATRFAHKHIFSLIVHSIISGFYFPHMSSNYVHIKTLDIKLASFTVLPFNALDNDRTRVELQILFPFHNLTIYV